tara:strand:+ start:591 stop:908 length:318 start_codon:yes stop_codon:yes gene_type:complete
MFDFFENNDNDVFFDNCDIEMEKINNLYDECEKIYYENKIMIQKDENMFNVYMMFSVVLYMLLIGSNVDNYLKKYYINFFFENSIEKNINKLDDVNILDDVNMLD